MPQDPLKVVLVDDEPISLLSLKTLLQSYSHLKIVGEATSGKEARLLVEQTRPHALFLDIQMPHENGFDVVNQLPFPLHFIFVTSSDAYALRAFEVNALDYLLKPVQKKRLSEAIHRLNEKVSHSSSSPPLKQFQETDLAFLQLEKQQLFIPVESIIWIESRKNYSTVYLKDGRHFIVKRSLNTWEKQLDPNAFFRANRNAIIKKSAIQELESSEKGTKIFLQNHKIPLLVSRRKSLLLKKEIKNVTKI